VGVQGKVTAQKTTFVRKNTISRDTARKKWKKSLEENPKSRRCVHVSKTQQKTHRCVKRDQVFGGKERGEKRKGRPSKMFLFWRTDGTTAGKTEANRANIADPEEDVGIGGKKKGKKPGAPLPAPQQQRTTSR